jgi:hypothetical protein
MLENDPELRKVPLDCHVGVKFDWYLLTVNE